MASRKQKRKRKKKAQKLKKGPRRKKKGKPPFRPSNLKSRLKSQMRRMWQWWEPRRIFLRNAKKCAICGRKKAMGVKLEADHAKPIVPPEGWPDNIYWSKVVEGMFFGKLQALCKKCHDEKTKKEREARYGNG